MTAVDALILIFAYFLGLMSVTILAAYILFMIDYKQDQRAAKQRSLKK